MRKETLQQALRVSVAGNRQCGGHGNEGETSWTRSWGQWSEAWPDKEHRGRTGKEQGTAGAVSESSHSPALSR